jgi:peptidoglycan/xylan/chitin deacetylase (PgdA/CDA1 family)
MKTVLLSFDLEEFDMPLEYGQTLPLNEQIQISSEGTRIILDILHKHNVRATFFSTVVFALHEPDLIHRIGSEGHELGSHGYYHSTFQPSHIKESKAELERISGKDVIGYRMARMMPVNNQDIRNAGYSYNSSLNPVFLPGRYNNLSRPRTLFSEHGVLQLPASATPLIRFPLFWLSFHNLPLWLYKLACARTINSDGYLNIYLHPWEFTDLKRPRYGLPKYVSKNSGAAMRDRFAELLQWMKMKDYSFKPIKDFLLDGKHLLNIR